MRSGDVCIAAFTTYFTNNLIISEFAKHLLIKSTKHHTSSYVSV